MHVECLNVQRFQRLKVSSYERWKLFEHNQDSEQRWTARMSNTLASSLRNLFLGLDSKRERSEGMGENSNSSLGPPENPAAGGAEKRPRRSDNTSRSSESPNPSVRPSKEEGSMASLIVPVSQMLEGEMGGQFGEASSEAGSDVRGSDLRGSDISVDRGSDISLPPQNYRDSLLSTARLSEQSAILPKASIINLRPVAGQANGGGTQNLPTSTDPSPHSSLSSDRSSDVSTSYLQNSGNSLPPGPMHPAIGGMFSGNRNRVAPEVVEKEKEQGDMSATARLQLIRLSDNPKPKEGAAEGAGGLRTDG